MNFQKAPETHSSREARQTSGVQTLRLPFLARITELVAERGFGFVTCESMPEGLFFHVTANSMGRRDFIDVEAEDLVLCQIGTRPKEPGRRCVVRAAPALKPILSFLLLLAWSGALQRRCVSSP